MVWSWWYEEEYVDEFWEEYDIEEEEYEEDEWELLEEEFWEEDDP